jgi:serine/threonine-protein kinase
MQGELQTIPRPVLDEATRSFVRRSLAAGLVELDDLKKVVVSLMAESQAFTPTRLAGGLVGAGVLTQWQANKLLAGKCRNVAASIWGAIACCALWVKGAWASFTWANIT